MNKESRIEFHLGEPIAMHQPDRHQGHEQTLRDRGLTLLCLSA
jgi:hypothetical protein